MTIVDEPALLALAARLCREARCDEPKALSQLAGGRNNRVFRVETQDGAAVVLKCYFRDARDMRDRRAAEWELLTYAASLGVANVPQALATGQSEGASLLGFVNGERSRPGELTASSVAAALDFVVGLNPVRRDLTHVSAASEACFSTAEHVTTVARRVERLFSLDPSAPFHDEAADFVSGDLAAAWERTTGRLKQVLGSYRIHEGDIIYSPSDFGFHNALVDDEGRVSFIDFEYAGRDDAAKLVCDFFCQPDVPVPLEAFDDVTQQLAARVALSDGFVARSRLLLDAYRIKWACIMLNDFLPGEDARRRYATPGDRAVRCKGQLAKARRALLQIQSLN